MMFTCNSSTHPDASHSRRPARASRSGSAKSVATARVSASNKLVDKKNPRALHIDLHCHFLNSEVQARITPLNPGQHEPAVRFANALTREVNVKQIRERGRKLSSIEVRLQDMDRMGIDIQAVSPAPNQCCYWPEPDFGAELARMVNDRLAEICAAWPDRFVALGTVPLQNAQLAVAELERCVKKLGLRGVEILPNVNGLDLTDPRLGLEKFFARAQELDVVIFMHPLGYTQGDRLLDHYFNNVIGNPLETTVAVSHLIFDGMMSRNPKLKIVLPHAGGYLAHYWARMDHAHRARPDCRTVIKKPPSTYLKKFFFDTIAFDPDMLRHLIDQYGSRHVVLGTDYPYDMGEENPLSLIRSVRRLKRSDQELIMGGNAARLLKIKPPR